MRFWLKAIWMNTKGAARILAELLVALFIALLGVAGVCLCSAVVFFIIINLFTEVQILTGLWWMTWGMVGLLAFEAIYLGFKKIKSTKEELENGNSTDAGDPETEEKGRVPEPTESASDGRPDANYAAGGAGVHDADCP